MGKELVVFNPEFIEECKAIITESEFASRWALVEGYWLLGQRIREESKDKSITQFTARLAVALGRSERTLYYAVQAFDRYPQLDTMPEGKAISWSKLVTKYLPSQNKSILECIHKPIVICSKCKQKLEDYNAIKRL